MFMKTKEKETVVVGNLNEIIVKRKEALLKKFINIPIAIYG